MSTSAVTETEARDLQVGDVIIRHLSDVRVTAVRVSRNRRTVNLDVVDDRNGNDPRSFDLSGDALLFVLRPTV